MKTFAKKLSVVLALFVICPQAFSQSLNRKVRIAQEQFAVKNYVQATQKLAEVYREKPSHKRAIEASWMIPKSISICEKSIARLDQKYQEKNASMSVIDAEENRILIINDILKTYGSLNKINEEIETLPPIYDKKQRRTIEFETHDYRQDIKRYKDLIKKSKETIAEQYYLKGKELLSSSESEKYKQAAKNFKLATEYVANYKDADEQYLKAKKAGMVRVAIFPFENKSGNSRMGAVQDILADKLIESLVKAEYVDVVTRDEIDKVIEEQKLSVSGLIDESTAVEVGQLLGVQVMLTGKITQLWVKEPRTERQTSQESGKILVYSDTGEEVSILGTVIGILTKNTDDRETHQETIHAMVTNYQRTASAYVSGSYRILDVKTGAIKNTASYDEKFEFNHRWATYTGHPKALSRSSEDLCKRKPISAPSSAVMVNQCLEKITERLKKDIIQYLN